MADIKRLHYYDHQYLREPDFTDEQKYHLDMRHLHNRSLHTVGVVTGLVVTKINNKKIEVSTGLAIDSQGREIYLQTKWTKVTSVTTSDSRFVTIKYSEEQTDAPPPEFKVSDTDRTRWTQKAIVEIIPQSEIVSGINIVLGSVKFSNGNISGIDDGVGKDVRTHSGASGSLGYENSINDFGSLLRSGFYQGHGAITGDVPDTSHQWSHLITTRHNNINNNHQLQIASSYNENDKLYFRKIAHDAVDSRNPAWHEVATRGTNTFSGNQHFMNGKVGIGSNEPEYSLDVRKTGDFVARFGDNAGNDLTIDVAGGQGLADIVAGAKAKGNNYVFTGTRGASRIRLHDGNLQLLTSTDTSGTAGDTITWNPGLCIDHQGNVGIGTTSPNEKLDVNGTMRTSGAIYAGNSDLYFTNNNHNHTGIGNTTGYAAIENARNYDALMILGRAGTTKGRYVRLWDYLQVNGNLEITGHLTKLNVAENFDAIVRAADFKLGHSTRRGSPGRAMVDYKTAAGTKQLRLNYGADWAGVRYSGNFGPTSSRKLKENIGHLPDEEAVSLLKQLEPVKFTLKSDKSKKLHLGFIAEDSPDPIADEDKETILIDYIIAVLARVLKVQQRVITDLLGRVKKLEKKVM